MRNVYVLLSLLAATSMSSYLILGLQDSEPEVMASKIQDHGGGRYSVDDFEVFIPDIKLIPDVTRTVFRAVVEYPDMTWSSESTDRSRQVYFWMTPSSKSRRVLTTDDFSVRDGVSLADYGLLEYKNDYGVKARTYFEISESGEVEKIVECSNDFISVPPASPGRWQSCSGRAWFQSGVFVEFEFDIGLMRDWKNFSQLMDQFFLDIRIDVDGS